MFSKSKFGLLAAHPSRFRDDGERCSETRDFYDIDKEAGIHQFSFYAIWFFTTCGLLIVVLPFYIFYIYKRSTIENDAADNFKYTLLDYNEVTSERIPADWKGAKAICFGDSMISSKRGRTTVKHFPSGFPHKTHVTSSELKLSRATKVPSSKTSHTSVGTALELAKKISLAMKNCPRDMPVDSIMSESPQSSESSTGKQTASSVQMVYPTLRRKGASKTGDEAEPSSHSSSESHMRV
uniref:Nematode cuticle collagen N-terminal domain-containing protein n=1 Tax=Ascaris lumbricoides TaxID=6252 RepID=A0A0M3HZI9_ASCLU